MKSTVKNSGHYRWKNKTVSMVLSTALALSSFTGMTVTAVSDGDSVEIKDYGLMDTCQEGTILHCFDWKYTDIIDELENIAKAGFSSIQTSPAQKGGGSGTWWWLYQPLGFYIGDNDLGTKEELTELCEKAHEYGIKVIVDVVANHLAGDHTYIQEDLKDSQYWRTEPSSWSGYDDRYVTTHKSLGMGDIVSENSYVQEVVANYVQELKSVGVDGIRWDAIKHVQLPSEDCAFFDVVIDDEMYNYGEILGDPGASTDTQNKALMKEYTNYMSVTDDVYGRDLRNSFNSGSIPTTIGNWGNRGIEKDKLVYWGESHDTWSNNKDWGYSNEMTQNVIDRAYAIAASQQNTTALYFSRPSTAVKDDITAGVKGSTHFTSAEVAAVNHFHNMMSGQSEYYSRSSTCAAVCREQGAVVVAASGGNKAVSVPNGDGVNGIMTPGTYTDEVTGNTWTVTKTTISGTIGSAGIAAIYEDAIYAGTVSATPKTNTAFTDTLDVTLKAINVNNAAYTTSEGMTGTYTNNDKITVGSLTEVGEYVTVTVTGTKSDGTEVSATYQYRKKDPNERVMSYFDNSAYNWNTVYAYVYDDDDNKLADWPGVQMSYNSSLGYYEIDVTDYSENGYIIFTESKGATTNRYPADGEMGMEIGSNSMVFSANHSWTEYVQPAELGVVSASEVNNTTFSDTLEVVLYAANVTDSTYTIDNGTAVPYENGDTITLNGTSVVTLSGIQSDGVQVSTSYTYIKTGDTVMAYFDNSTYNWSTVYAYVYDDGTIGEQATWPGTLMTYNSSLGYYEIDITDYSGTGYIIFAEKKGSSNRYPASSEPGMDIGVASMVFSANYDWSYYIPTDISSAVVELEDDVIGYDGTEKTAVIQSVALNGDELDTAYYDVTGNIAADKGTYTLTVTGKGIYKGSVSKTWKIAQLYTVTSVVDDVQTSTVYEEKSSARVTADKNIGTMKFSHWEVSGKKVSTSATYSFIVLNDVTVNAVYVDESQTVIEEPVLNLETSKTTYNNKNAVQFLFTHSLPSGYTVKEVGVKYATNKLVGADTTVSGYANVDLTQDNTLGVDDVESVIKNNSTGNVKSYKASYALRNGTVSFSYAVGKNTSAYVYAVGYVTAVKDGKTQTFYTNLAAVTYNSCS